jgi:anti-sigma factor RsiW
MNQTDHNHENCHQLFEKLSEYLDGELSEAQHKEIKHHAEACLKCHSCLETLRRTVDLCESLKPEPIPEDFARTLADIFRDMKA